MPYLVSVVMPVYNAEKYIEEAVLSCENQTYRDIEMILVNDGSTDESLRIMKELAVRFNNIRVIDLPHGGKVNAMNAGVEQVKGEYIAILAADDVAFPYRFQLQVDIIEQDPEISLVFGDMEVVDEDLRMINPSFWQSKHIRIPQKNHFEELLTYNFVSGGTILLRAGLRKNIFPIPNELEFEDWWIALTASYYGKLIYSKQILIKYRQHATNSNSMLGKSNMVSWVNRQKKLFARNIAYYGVFKNFVKSNIENLTLRNRYIDLIEGSRTRDFIAITNGLRSRFLLLRLYLSKTPRFIGTRDVVKLIIYSILGKKVFVCKYGVMLLYNWLSRRANASQKSFR